MTMESAFQPIITKDNIVSVVFDLLDEINLHILLRYSNFFLIYKLQEFH